MARDQILHPQINEMAIELYSGWKRRVNATAFEDFDGLTVQKINQLLHEISPEAYDKYMPETLIPLLDHTYIYPKLLKEKLQNEGYMILAISGSRKEEVALFAEYHSFDDWIGQTWHRDKSGKKFTGKVTATYKDKHLLLDKLVSKHNLTYKDSYAIGDTAGDISILERVDNPIAFNPNHTLLAHAKNAKWKIVLERKSIIYELEPQNGTYLLA